jgi:hypothetical protein
MIRRFSNMVRKKIFSRVSSFMVLILMCFLVLSGCEIADPEADITPEITPETKP